MPAAGTWARTAVVFLFSTIQPHCSQSILAKMHRPSVAEITIQKWDAKRLDERRRDVEGDIDAARVYSL
jgi:hypothetical protein